jgi:uncharacterized metal-binding protein
MKMSVCATCNIKRSRRACSVEDGVGPKGCPTLSLAEILSKARDKYDGKDINLLAVQASAQEAACYANRGSEPGYVLQPTKPRIQEIWEFAHRMGYSKVGLAFCVGLQNEAGITAPILEKHGLEVVSVICKVGRLEHVGVYARDVRQPLFVALGKVGAEVSGTIQGGLVGPGWYVVLDNLPGIIPQDTRLSQALVRLAPLCCSFPVVSRSTSHPEAGFRSTKRAPTGHFLRLRFF